MSSSQPPVRQRQHRHMSRDVPERDPNMVARGYCGRIDDIGRARCYRRAGHEGRCAFSRCFQLPQADAPDATDPRGLRH